MEELTEAGLSPTPVGVGLGAGGLSPAKSTFNHTEKTEEAKNEGANPTGSDEDSEPAAVPQERAL